MKVREGGLDPECPAAYAWGWVEEDPAAAVWDNWHLAGHHVPLLLPASISALRFVKFHPSTDQNQATMLDTEWKRTHMKSGTLETWLDIIFAASRSCFHLNLRISSIHSSGERQDQAALYPCSTKTREVLGNPSPTTVRFPKTREISRGRSPGEI